MNPAASKTSDAKMPDPLREQPPADRFCDLVLNGGVASGVVYPWALLHLARHYRFKSIGGNSVGAMAAVLAAAAEYGRCNGFADAFEPLRRLPTGLAEEDPASGKTKMLRLFQPSPAVARLFELFLAAVASSDGPSAAQPSRAPSLIGGLLRLYGFWPPLLLLLLPLGWALLQLRGAEVLVLAPLGLLGAVLVAALVVGVRIYGDLWALAKNGYGLCTGRGQVPDEEGLVEWLHKGIQLSAGRGREDPPLSFADLWAVPRFGRPGPSPRPGGLQPDNPGIELQMFTSNVTQGRPVRLPLNDANTRLFYDPQEWQAYFPPTVMDALNQASVPYRPASRTEPDPARPLNDEQMALMARLRELPSGGMPIVVAARLSLCFPLLFSAVKVYAVDFEAPARQRQIRPCLLSDGGLCTNFPVHLFDAAHPKWPTFALLLDRRLRAYAGQKVWLPRRHLEGRADNWQRSVPGAEDDDTGERPLASRLLGFAGGLLLTMKDWNDRVTGRLPHVRNRIIRLALKQGEGQLNIAMPRATILRMARVYGTRAGVRLVRRFAPREEGAAPAWREHLYVRSMIELRALRKHLKGYAEAVTARGDTLPLRELLDEAHCAEPLRSRKNGSDRSARRLSTPQYRALERAVSAVEALEAELAACEAEFGPYLPVLEPELRLRPPV